MSLNQKTIIYYTSNREDPVFEAKIRTSILKQKGNLPIISVSQKPIDFGENICVGDVGHSSFNAFRQLLIGARVAKTPYIVLAEADFLYPEDYFSFEPKGANVYRYSNLWIVFKRKFYSYRRKIYSDGAMIVKREYLIELLEEFLDGAPEWHDGESGSTRFHKNGALKYGPYDRIPFEYFGNEIPVINFKTGDGLRWKTDFLPGRENISSRLPYWGRISTIRKEYLNGIFQ